ncbi:hypothetical protein M513_08727 [Trichuris suis]|uniref:Uncharacterized protein n=1 Tax=Trichuris suis TaxID=68888 RepID=A0A085LZE9_9BILA|nr:hypothetical protein M513_08727 [Trichuris suis]
MCVAAIFQTFSPEWLMCKLYGDEAPCVVDIWCPCIMDHLVKHLRRLTHCLITMTVVQGRHNLMDDKSCRSVQGLSSLDVPVFHVLCRFEVIISWTQEFNTGASLDGHSTFYNFQKLRW